MPYVLASYLCAFGAGACALALWQGLRARRFAHAAELALGAVSLTVIGLCAFTVFV